MHLTDLPDSRLVDWNRAKNSGNVFQYDYNVNVYCNRVLMMYAADVEMRFIDLVVPMIYCVHVML